MIALVRKASRKATALAIGFFALGPLAAPAQAATITSSVHTNLVTGIGVNKLADLSFGDMLSPTGLSTVNVDSNGAITTGGPVVTAGGTVTPATFIVNQAGGGAGRFWVQVPSSVTISRSGGGGSMTINNFNAATNINMPAGCVSTTIAVPAGPKGGCPKAQNYTLRIGGRLSVGTSQAAGAYSGTFTITVNLW